MKKKLFQEYLILVPRQEDCSRVKEHLRYWPYVKAFSGHAAITVRVLLGRIRSPQARVHYTKRSRELIYQCLRQYRVTVVDFCPKHLPPIRYKPDLFLRPDDQLRDFRTFIDELDGSKDPKFQGSKRNELKH